MSLSTVQERFGRVLHQLEILALLRVERGPERQVRHADDGVHRRADLVAHVGQEFALRPAGRLRGLLGLGELALALLPVGDVRVRRDKASLSPRMDPDLVDTPIGAGPFIAGGLSRSDRGHPLADQNVWVAGSVLAALHPVPDDLGKGLAGLHQVRREAEHLQGPGVPRDESKVLVVHRHALADAVHGGLKQRGRAGKFALPPSQQRLAGRAQIAATPAGQEPIERPAIAATHARADGRHAPMSGGPVGGLALRAGQHDHPEAVGRVGPGQRDPRAEAASQEGKDGVHIMAAPPDTQCQRLVGMRGQRLGQRRWQHSLTGVLLAGRHRHPGGRRLRRRGSRIEHEHGRHIHGHGTAQLVEQGPESRLGVPRGRERAAQIANAFPAEDQLIVVQTAAVVIGPGVPTRLRQCTDLP